MTDTGHYGRWLTPTGLLSGEEPFGAACGTRTPDPKRKFRTAESGRSKPRKRTVDAPGSSGGLSSWAKIMLPRNRRRRIGGACEGKQMAGPIWVRHLMSLNLVLATPGTPQPQALPWSA